MNMRNYRTAILAVAGLAVLALASLVFSDISAVAATPLYVAAVVQSAYSERQAAGLPGMVATMNDYDVDTRQVETVAGIGFGLACGRGNRHNGVIPRRRGGP